MPRLTKRVLDLAPTREQSYYLWCSDLPGFGVRIFPSGKRVYYCDYYADGTRRRMAIGQHGKITTEQARKLALATLGNVVKGGDPAAERTAARKAVTVAELCQRYLAAAERGLIMGKRQLPKKASTLATDRGRIARHIVPLLGSKRVRDLTPADINKFIRSVAAGETATVEKTDKLRGKAIVEGGLGAATRTAGLLGGILSFAVSEGLRDNNPASGVKRPAGRRRQRRLSRDEYAALGKALASGGVSWQVIGIVQLLALTGARVGEIVNLKWAEVDRKAHCLRLHDSKEGASIRPLGKPALELIAQFQRTSGFVFPAVRRGGAFGGLPRGWRRLMVKAGLSKVSPHVLRHSFASTADDLDCSLPTISALLGHATVSSTTARYVHKVDAALIAAADRVATAIRNRMQNKPRRGRPSEPDDGLLPGMALMVGQGGMSDRKAAKLAAREIRNGQSDVASAARLRRKYRTQRARLERWVKNIPEFGENEHWGEADLDQLGGTKISK